MRFEDGFRVWEAGDSSIVLVDFVGAVEGLLFEALEELVEEAVGLTTLAAFAFVLGVGEMVEDAEAFGVGGDDFDEAFVGGGRAAMLEGVHVALRGTGAGTATTFWHWLDIVAKKNIEIQEVNVPPWACLCQFPRVEATAIHIGLLQVALTAGRVGD